ncbi:MAG: PqqD family protein [Xanthobacteraceae bacterium]|nr:PqqD family protein [Xanthobacteraceae bacterium]
MEIATTMPEFMTRASGLEIHEVPDGYIVYHSARDNVSYLNKTAAIIFEFCDGNLPADDIVERVSKIFDLGQSSDQEIRACLESLIKEGLVQASSKSLP